jgi:hypothetical protein
MVSVERSNSPIDDVDASDWVEEEEEQEDLDEEAVDDEEEEGMDEQIGVVVDETVRVNQNIVDAKVVGVRFADKSNSGAEEEKEEEVDPRRITNNWTDVERRKMLADRKENDAEDAMSRSRARENGPDDDEWPPAHKDDDHHVSSLLDDDEYVQRLKSVAAADNDRAGVAVTGLTFATTMAWRSFSKLVGGDDGGDSLVLDEDDIAAAVIMGTAQGGQGGAGGGVAAGTGTAAATTTQP